ncbi:hypothetical protein [Paractinoplanes lichenicola]|uniref:Uncharacterized protein n=1 Tax=Paractinoplanes lichenicola TaxID=2802976 RepID=A0ABS1VXM7_9ACTN|nr:hypothetical protein [Actinoplanes lichenicola]MBL7259250.1 hypothetical protein [Actinoplanes lichenicola]
MAALTMIFTASAPASAAARFEKYFSFESTSFDWTDENGTFSANVSIFNPGHTLAWGFNLSPALRAVAASSMTCVARGYDANLQPTGYFDQHLVPFDYTWHSSIANEPWNQDRAMTGLCQFRINPRGTATVRFQFNYEISDRGLGCTPNCPRVQRSDDSAGAYTSELSIDYDR